MFFRRLGLAAACVMIHAVSGCAAPDGAPSGSTSSADSTDPRFDATGYFTDFVAPSASSVDSFTRVYPGDAACLTTDVPVSAVFRFGQASATSLTIDSVEIYGGATAAQLLIGGSSGGRFGPLGGMSDGGGGLVFDVHTTFDIHDYHYVEGRLYLGEFTGPAESAQDLGTQAACSQIIPFAFFVE